MVNLKARESAIANAAAEIYEVGFKSAVDGGVAHALAKKASKHIETEVQNYFSECSKSDARAYINAACPVNRGWFNKLLRRASGKSENASMKAARRGQLQVGNIYLRALLSGISEDDLRYRPLSDIIAKVNFGSYPTLGQELHMGQVYGTHGPVFTWGPTMHNLPSDVRVFAIHYRKGRRHADEGLFGPAFNGIIALRPSMSGDTLTERGARVDDCPDQGWDVYGMIMISPTGELLLGTGELRDPHLFVTDKHGTEQAVQPAKATSCMHSADILAEWDFPVKFIDRTPKGKTKEETKYVLDSLCRHNAERV